jgi:polar amino acid transport system substrate-binding protein
MKKLILLFLILISLNSFTQTTELKLASDIWPPFTNIEGEKSFALDLVREALSRININTLIEILDFDVVISEIDAGTFDGSAALWLSAERKKKYLFSSPYLQNQIILVGKKGSDVNASSIAELTGKRIGIVKDYAYGEEITSSKSIIIVKGKSDQQNLERLLSDKIDYMLVDALLIQYMLKFQLNDVTEFLEIADNALVIKSLHFALRKDTPEGKSIISRFDEEIKKMISDGTYNDILELNWIRADVDGDGKFELVLDGTQAGTEAPQNIYEVFINQTDAEQAEVNRYYIDGKLYNSWEEIPVQYKQKELKGGAYDPNLAPNDYGLKLKF